MKKDYLSLFYEAVHGYRSSCTAEFRGHRLSPNAFVILRLLCHQPEVDKAVDIAKQCGVSTSLVSRSVDQMVRQGILETVRDEKDRRIIHIQIREDCKEIRDVIDRTNACFYANLTAGISEEELSVFFDVFHRMMLNLKSKEQKGVEA